MQLLKDLLEATIKYQDVMDELGRGSVDFLQDKMLDLADQAKKKYPELIGAYYFGFKKNRQEEFDNLQKFINDFHRIK
jgi:hypothetical protein